MAPAGTCPWLSPSGRWWGEDAERVARRVAQVGERRRARAGVEVLADHRAAELLGVGAGGLDAGGKDVEHGVARHLAAGAEDAAHRPVGPGGLDVAVVHAAGRRGPVGLEAPV